jgi:hypothetical protein
MREQGRGDKAWHLERQQLELEAEARGCSVPQEGAIIRAELASVEWQLRNREQRMEQLAALPGFWETIFGDGRGYLALFSGLRPEPGARLTLPHQAYFEFPGATAAAVRWIERGAGEGRDLYHCAHLLRRAHRRAEDAAPLKSLYVDLDGELPEQPLIPPTIVVESSPGHSQLYYRLTRPVEPRQGAQLNRRLAAALEGDPSGWDLTQLLRVPGTHNRKYPDRPLVRLVEEHSLAYDPRELEAFLPQLPAAPLRRRQVTLAPEIQPERGGGEPPVRLTGPARAIWNGQDAVLTPDGRVDRSASLVRIARILHQAGFKRELIVTALAERDIALEWRKFSDRPDAAARYRQVVDLVIQGGRNRRQ